MKTRIGQMTFALVFVSALSVAPPRGWAGGLEELLGVMPADAPIAIVMR